MDNLLLTQRGQRSCPRHPFKEVTGISNDFHFYFKKISLLHKMLPEKKPPEPKPSQKRKKQVLDLPGHAHFITFSCYKRRRLLADDTAKRIFIHWLSRQVHRHEAKCHGFVVMPDHVHLLIRFPEPGRLVPFIQHLKRLSSISIKRHFAEKPKQAAQNLDGADPVWQRKYYDFNVTTDEKLTEKLTYMHENPVQAGLVEQAIDWLFGSAVWYHSKRRVGVPITMP